MSEFKVSNEKERLLCYTAALLSAKLSNPNNVSTPKALIKGSISEAKELIEAVYNS